MHLHLRPHDVHGRNDPFSLIIAVQILVAEPLDNRLKKSYNTTTLVGRFGNKTTTAVDHKSSK